MGKGISSSIWDYFAKVIDDQSKVICKKCNIKISRGSKDPKKMTNSNMVSHLKAKHKDLFGEYQKKDEENNEKKRKALEELGDVGSSALKNKKQKDEYLQQNLAESIFKSKTWSKDDPKVIEADKKVLNMIIEDLRPYSDVNRGGLLQLLKTLQPKFQPKSDKYYRDMMQASYIKCKEVSQEKIRVDNPDQISLVLDGWSQFHHGYIGINVHYIDGNWERKKVNLGCKKFDESHTGEALATFTADITQEWNIYDKIYVPVTDSAANMIKMFKHLPVWWDRADCGNHTLQCVIKDEIFSMPTVENLTGKCRDVAKYSNKSVLLSQALIEAQVEVSPDSPGLYLVQDVSTRWNSTFMMLERFFKLKDAINKVLEMPKWEDKVQIKFYNSDWELMAKLVKVLRGFKEATEMLSSSEASISQIIPIVTIIKESLLVSSGDQGVKTLKKGLGAALEKRFATKEFDSKFAVATLLDPRYKKNFFTSKAAKESAVASLLEEFKEEVKKSTGLDGLLEQPAVDHEEVLDDEKFTMKSLMKKVITKSQKEENSNTDLSGKEMEVLQAYLSSPVEEKRCLGFWKEFEQNSLGNPVKLALAKLAKKYLTPPPTSTDVERLFSVAGLILSDERNRLLPENVDKLLFIKENIRNKIFKI